MRLTIRFYLVVMLVAGAIFALGAGRSGREFVSADFPYKLVVPEGWNISVSRSGVLGMSNYSPGRGLPQGMVPFGGADIYLVPYSVVQVVAPASTLNGWIESNLSSTRSYSGVVTRALSDLNNHGTWLRDLHLVEADFERNPQDSSFQREVNYYFVLNSGMYRLRLVYWKGERKGGTFFQLFRKFFTALSPNSWCFPMVEGDSPMNWWFGSAPGALWAIFRLRGGHFH